MRDYVCDCQIVGPKCWLLLIYYFIIQIYTTLARDILRCTMMDFKLRNGNYKYSTLKNFCEHFPYKEIYKKK